MTRPYHGGRHENASTEVETRVHQAASGRLTSPGSVALLAGFAAFGGFVTPAGGWGTPPRGEGVQGAKGRGKPGTPRKPAPVRR